MNTPDQNLTDIAVSIKNPGEFLVNVEAVEDSLDAVCLRQLDAEFIATIDKVEDALTLMWEAQGLARVLESNLFHELKEPAHVTQMRAATTLAMFERLSTAYESLEQLTCAMTDVKNNRRLKAWRAIDAGELERRAEADSTAQAEAPSHAE